MTFFTRITQPGGLSGLNPARTRMVRQLRHGSPFLGCRFDHSGRFVFGSTQDFGIQRFRLNDWSKTTLAGHRSWVRGMAFVPSRNELVSGDYHGKLIWWPAHADRPEPIRTIEAHDGWVRAVAVNPAGNLVASCGNDQLVKIWSASDGALVREISGHDCHVYNVAFHPRENFLVSADHRGVVKQWDLSNGRETRTLDAGMLHRYDPTFRAIIGGIRSMAFNADGSRLICGGITDVSNAFAGVGKPAIVHFDWQSGNRRLMRPAQNFRGTMWGVDFHPDGLIVGVAGGSGGKMWFWRGTADRSFAQVNLPNVARDVDLHRDGRRLAIPFYDNSLRIYEIPNA